MFVGTNFTPYAYKAYAWVSIDCLLMSFFGNAPSNYVLRISCLYIQDYSANFVKDTSTHCHANFVRLQFIVFNRDFVSANILIREPFK